MDGMSSGLVGEIAHELEYLSEIDENRSVSPFRGGASRASQQTIGNPISCTGVGLHSGRPVTLTLRPAAENTGIVFCRTDLGRMMPAPS